MDLLPESEMSVNEAVASVHEMYQRGHKSLKGAWKHKRQFEEFYWSKVGAANLLNSLLPLGDCERGRLLSIVTDVSHVEHSCKPHSLSRHHRDYGFVPEFVCDASGYWHERNYKSPEKRMYEERIHQIFTAMVARKSALNVCLLSHRRLYCRASCQGPRNALSVCSGRTYYFQLCNLFEASAGSRETKKLCLIFGISPSEKKIQPKRSLSYVADWNSESIDGVLRGLDTVLAAFSRDLKTYLVK